MSNQPQRPEVDFRVGAISAAVWRNTETEGDREISRFSVKIIKQYKDENDDWRDTTTFFQHDLPKLTLVAQKAYEYISLKEKYNEAGEAA